MSELLSRLRAAFQDLSARERLLVSIVAGLAAFLAVSLGVVKPIVQARSRTWERAEEAERQLARMRSMRREYDGIAARVSAVEQRIRGNVDRRKIRTLLDSLASQSSVKIDSMEERQTPDSELYRETKVEVSLKNVTLTQTVNYLHNIESAGRLLSIKSLRIKNRKGRSDGAGLLDVTFSVSSFEPR